MNETIQNRKSLPIRKKLIYGAALTLFCCLILMLVFKAYAAALGIRDHEFRYENQIGVLAHDPVIGFRNKENFDDYCFLTVHATTNAQGFRGREPTLREKPAGTTRIIGLGDSVMWGTGVNQEDSFLGLLQAKLNARPEKYEVINSGVIGYSTLQEQLLLEDHLLAFSPDIVLVNLCQNDMLPSENPFGDVRSLYIKYVTVLLQSPHTPFSDDERHILGRVLQMLHSVDNVYAEVASAPEDASRVLLKMCIELPVRRMIEVARQNHFRLIYLLIPSRADDSLYGPLVSELKPLLIEEGIEFLDFQDLHRGKLLPQPGFLSRDVWPKLRYTPLRDLHNILLLTQLERRHEQDNFIDWVHPTKKGNRRIADGIFQYLTKEELPK